MKCANCAAWEARYHDLVKELTLMKREGFHANPTFSAPPVADDIAPEVRAAIAEICTPGDLTWRHQVKLAREMAAEGKTPDEIAAEIRAGEPAPL